MPEHCIIVGGGHGGAQLCASLRQNDYNGNITMVSRDVELPYHRPPLSKTFLKDPSVQTQIIKPQAFYDDNGIRLVLGKSITAIDSACHQVELDDNVRLDYTKLVLCTGARPRQLKIAGADAAGVHYLKIAEDAAELRTELAEATSVGVIGGGFIGLEAAATFASLGKNVTVFEAADRLLGRAVSPEISNYFLHRHIAAGVDVRLDASVDEIAVAQGRACGVLSDGEIINANLILIGIGVDACSELAEAVGITCNNGIEIDPHMQTSAVDILAVGDCVSFKHWQTGSRVRLESVQNANDQARNAALTLTGNPEPYQDVPWFWSDQGNDKLQIAGLSNGADRRVVRSESDTGKLSVYHYFRSKLVAIDTVNNPKEHMIGRKLLKNGISPKVSDLKNREFDMMSLLQ